MSRLGMWLRFAGRSGGEVWLLGALVVLSGCSSSSQGPYSRSLEPAAKQGTTQERAQETVQAAAQPLGVPRPVWRTVVAHDRPPYGGDRYISDLAPLEDDLAPLEDDLAPLEDDLAPLEETRQSALILPVVIEQDVSAAASDFSRPLGWAAGGIPAEQVLTVLGQTTAEALRRQEVVVVRGDNLTAIARRYGVSPRALAQASDLPFEAVLKPGQRLTLPPSGRRKPLSDVLALKRTDASLKGGAVDSRRLARRYFARAPELETEPEAEAQPASLRPRFRPRSLSQAARPAAREEERARIPVPSARFLPSAWEESLEVSAGKEAGASVAVPLGREIRVARRPSKGVEETRDETKSALTSPLEARESSESASLLAARPQSGSPSLSQLVELERVLLPLGSPASPLGSPASPLGSSASSLGSPASPLESPASPLGSPASPLESPASPLESPASPLESPASPLESPASPLESPASPRRLTLDWPISGQVLVGFGPQDGGRFNDGINIAAPRGVLILAPASGQVIYSGNELRGYGELLLIAHDSGLVTAYAHIESPLVSIKEQITRGQAIALVGSSGNVSVPQLHFQVRSAGAPIDPLTVLGSPRASLRGALR